MHAISNKMKRNKTTLLLLFATLFSFFHSCYLLPTALLWELSQASKKQKTKKRRKTDAKYPRENARGRNTLFGSFNIGGSARFLYNSSTGAFPQDKKTSLAVSIYTYHIPIACKKIVIIWYIKYFNFFYFSILLLSLLTSFFFAFCCTTDILYY